MLSTGKSVIRTFVGAAACTVGFFALSILPSRAADMVPLPLKLPKTAFIGTPPQYIPVPKGVDKLTGIPREVPMAPKGTVNLAFKKKVTSSAAPFGDAPLSFITDGNKEADEAFEVEIKPRLQWVQIDLGEVDPLSYVVVWHTHREPVVFHNVVVQLSNDPNFVEGVRTIFNNDQENSVGAGVGKDREYVETNEGRLIDAKGTKARYVRLYSNGSTYLHDKLNRYTEVEVFGVPSK